MTIRVNLADLADLAEFVAHIEAGEDFVLLRDGETLATVNTLKKPANERRKRVPGAWAHFGQLQDPDLFLRPDPELEEAADGRIFPSE
jgi:antitoxin (DNA-binding transcriptional repressor) of toxin-antitoxin stability system